VSDTDDHEPPSDSRGNVPAYNPDPDLITFLEREAKPGEIRVWHPHKPD